MNVFGCCHCVNLWVCSMRTWWYLWCVVVRQSVCCCVLICLLCAHMLAVCSYACRVLIYLLCARMLAVCSYACCVIAMHACLLVSSILANSMQYTSRSSVRQWPICCIRMLYISCRSLYTNPDYRYKEEKTKQPIIRKNYNAAT